MKLGGLTWWRYNYGSILQAYALQEEINSYDNIEYEIICQYGKKVTSINNLKDKLKHLGLKATLKRIIWKFGLKKLRLRNYKIQQFLDNYLKISEKEYDENKIHLANKVYDGFICGSDQIWNPELTGTDSIYWLGFADSDKLKISYAPSIGVNKFTEEQSKTIRKHLKNFKAISVREQGGTKLINDILGGNKCVTVLDPTLLVDRTLWDSLSNKSLYKEHYIFVYMLRGTKEQRKLIEKFSKKKNLKIVTMPFLDSEKIELYDFIYGNIKLWDASPADFIKAIRYADYVFTDSFHCMVFSILYHREFFTFPKIGKAQLNRVVELQKLFKISDRMLSEYTSIQKIEHIKPVSWDVVDKILKRKQEQSREYLKNALSE